MRGWARRSARTVGARIETGGLVFGELNEAAGVLWVTEVEGPPPDSDASEEHFTCGVEGMMEAAKNKRCRFRGSVDCVGSWHTHPSSPPHPSDVDIGAVGQLLADPVSTRKNLLDPDSLRESSTILFLARMHSGQNCPVKVSSELNEAQQQQRSLGHASKSRGTWGSRCPAEVRVLSRFTWDVCVPCRTSIFLIAFRCFRVYRAGL